MRKNFTKSLMTTELVYPEVGNEASTYLFLAAAYEFVLTMALGLIKHDTTLARQYKEDPHLAYLLAGDVIFLYVDEGHDWDKKFSPSVNLTKALGKVAQKYKRAFRKTSKPSFKDETYWQSLADSSIDDAYDQKKEDILSRIDNFINQSPPTMRKFFHLRFKEGMKHYEIAPLIDKSYEATKKLSQRFKEDAEEFLNE